MIFNLEAEQSTIGACLIDQSVVDDVVSKLKPSDFWETKNVRLFACMTEMHADGKPIDPLTLSNWLKDTGRSFDGAVPYIYELGRNTSGSSNVSAYADIVLDHALRRQAHQAGRQIADLAEVEGKAGVVAEKAQELVSGLDRATINNLVRLNDITPAFVQALNDKLEGKTSPYGITTGIPDLDEKTMGLHGGKVYVVAARPGQGKTALAVHMTSGAAKTGVGVLFCNLEMNKEELFFRYTGNLGGVDGRALKDPQNMSDYQFDQMQAGLQAAQNMPLVINDNAQQTVASIRADAKKTKRMLGTEKFVVVVDYLQLISFPASRPGNREQDIAEASRAFKKLAKELNCPVVVLSQLNRGVEQRTDKRPIMSDLRESGAIEQDADVIAFIYRDEYYNENTEARGITEILIRKQRDGEVGTVYAGHNLASSRYIPLEESVVQKLQESKIKAPAKSLV